MAYWMSPLSPHVDVAEFNALPRNPHLPTSAANNHWHFDIRFIPFETNPSHVLFLVQPESGYFITEFLPLGVPPGGDHHAWFPETSVDAAPPVAKAILQCFLTGYSARPKRAEALGLSHSIQTFAPWSLSTCSGNLATAMEKEFKRLGVSEDRCTVEVSDIQTKGSTIDEAFSRWMQEFKWVLGISRVASGLLPDPRAIAFDYKIQSIQDAFKVSPDDQGTKMACGQQLWNCRPATREKIFYATEEPMYGMFHQDMQAVDLFDRIPTKLVAAEADKEGLPETMMNYGLRLLFGVDCVNNRKLGRLYFIKATEDSQASVTTKATAHGLLLSWYESSFPKDSLPDRYIFMACHHASEILELGNRVVYSPVVVDFVRHVFMDLANGRLKELYFHHLLLAQFHAVAEGDEASAKEERERRMGNPLRYSCANAGCALKPEAGKAFPQCSGKCDIDKKPSYCSVKCQRKDWKTHKPYCKPGMTCSIVKKEDTPEDAERRLWGPLYDTDFPRAI